MAGERQVRQQQAQTIVALELRVRAADEATAAHEERLATLRAELAAAQASALPRCPVGWLPVNMAEAMVRSVMGPLVAA